jgi:hypothetical protein
MNIRHYFNNRPLLFLQFLGWSIYFLLDIFDHAISGHFWFFPSLLCSTTAFMFTGTVAYITNKNDYRGAKIQSILFALLLLVAAVLWHKIWLYAHGDADSITQILTDISQVSGYSLRQWLTTGYYPLFAFVAWSGLFVGSKWYFVQLQQQMELGQAVLKTKQAQLQTLRYQLNPHFLFNVLNSIDISILSDEKDTAHKMVLQLSRFLRNTLEYGEQDKISLEKEFELIKDFSNIEQLRFGDALALSIEIEVGCEQAMLPSMILQPLVENAIKFAWSQTTKGHVSIVARKQQNHLIIEIINSLTKQDNFIQGTGTGLKNTQSRLALVYGDDAQISTQETLENFTVLLTLPWEISLN